MYPTEIDDSYYSWDRPDAHETYREGPPIEAVTVTARYTVHHMPQRSAAWTQVRLGRLTSTGAAPMLATIKSGEAAERRNLRVRLALEQLTRRSQESDYCSSAMRQGIEREAEALALYETLIRADVTQTGFLAHPTLAAGASLDGLIGELDQIEGIVEVKAPLAATHLESLRTDTISPAHARQILHMLWLTGAAYADFVSFCPDFPAGLQILIKRQHRDEQQVRLYGDCVARFLDEVGAEVADVRRLAAGRR